MAELSPSTLEAIAHDRPEDLAEEDIGPDQRFAGAILSPLLQYGWAALIMIAGLFGALEVFRFLVIHDHNPRSIDENGGTMAHYACASGNLDLVIDLYNQGIPFDCWDYEGKSPGDYAAMMGHGHILEWLLRQGLLNETLDEWRGPKSKVMHHAASLGHVDVILFLVKNGVPILRESDPLPEDGTTPVHLAAQGGHREALIMLLECGWSANRPDSKGRTPITCAIESGSLACVNALCEMGAIQRGTEGASECVRLAAKLGRGNVLEFLNEWRGASGSWTDEDGAVHELSTLLEGVPDTATEVVLPPDVVELDSDTICFLVQLGHLTINTAVRNFPWPECDWHLKHVTVLDSHNTTKAGILACSVFVTWCLEHGVTIDGDATALVDIRTVQLRRGEWKVPWPKELMINGTRASPIIKFSREELTKALLRAQDMAIWMAANSTLRFTKRKDDAVKPRQASDPAEAERTPLQLIGGVRLTLLDGDMTRLERMLKPHKSKRVVDAAVQLGALDVVEALVDRFPSLIGAVCEAVARHGNLVHLLRRFPNEAGAPAVFISAVLGGKRDGLMTLLEMGIQPPRGWDIAACLADNGNALGELLIFVKPEEFTPLILQFDAWRCARVLELSPEEHLVDAVARRAMHVLANWMVDRRISRDDVLKCAITLEHPAVVSFAIAAGASVTPAMLDWCDDAAIVQLLTRNLQMTPPEPAPEGGAELDPNQSDGSEFGPDPFDGSEFGQPEFGGAEFGQPESDGAEFAPPESDGAEFAPPEFDGAEFGQPEFGGAEFGQPEFGGAEFGPDPFDGAEFGADEADAPEADDAEADAPEGDGGGVIRFRVAETDRRNLIRMPWADEGRQGVLGSVRFQIEEEAVADRLCICDEFTVAGESFELMLRQDGKVLRHWFGVPSTKRLTQDTLLGFAVRLDLDECPARTIVRDNRFRFEPQFYHFLIDHGFTILPLAPNSNDWAAPIESLAEQITEFVLSNQSGQSNVLELVASFVDTQNFANLFDGYPRIFAAASFGAGGPMMAMLRNGVWDGDFRFDIHCLAHISWKKEQTVFTLLATGASQADIAEFVELHPQTVRAMVDRRECGPGSIALNLDDARVLAVGPSADGPAVCYTDRLGHIDFIRVVDVLEYPRFAAHCVDYLVNGTQSPGKIIGACGDRAVIAVGPFLLEMAKSLLPAPLQCMLRPVSEGVLFGVVPINAEGGVNVSSDWLARLSVGVRPKVDVWTEAMVTAEGNSLVFVNDNGFARFQRTGLPAIVILNDPSGAGIANLSGRQPGQGACIELGWTYLLNRPAGQRFMNDVAFGGCPLNVAAFRSAAVQFGRAWPGEPRLRYIAWTFFAYWAIRQPFPSIRGLAQDAGVNRKTAERNLDRVLAVGLPLPEGYVDQRPVAWIQARRWCVRTLIEAERFVEWPTKIGRVDTHAAGLRGQAKRDEFVFVAQALLSLRLREMGEGRLPVRGELSAQGAPLKIDNLRLDATIAFVRDGLPEL